MNVEIGAEAALFPEKEYINGIAVVVCLLFILLPLLTMIEQKDSISRRTGYVQYLDGFL